MPLVHISDPKDPRLAAYRGVADPELLVAHGLFVVEGRLVVRRLLLESPFETASVLVTGRGLVALDDMPDERTRDLPVYVVPQAVMNTVSGFNLHRGCLAVGIRPAPLGLERLAGGFGAGARVLVLEGVSNPDNVGGIFRCAAALGAGWIVLGPGCGDPLYRKAIRTSIGTTLTVPFAQAGAWPDALGVLRQAGLTMVALTPASTAPDLRDVGRELPHRAPLALLVGAEGPGLSPAALAAADVRARIPIAPGVDSLNVTVAAAIALHALR